MVKQLMKLKHYLMRYRGKMNWFSAVQIKEAELSLADYLLDYNDSYARDISLVLISKMQNDGFRFFDSNHTFEKVQELVKDGVHICRYEDPHVEVIYRIIKGKNKVIEMGINYYHII